MFVSICKKILTGYLVFWMFVAVAVGSLFYSWFPYLTYFVVPFSLFALIGVAPASYGMLFIDFRSWRARGILTLVYVSVLGLLWFSPAAYRSAHEEPQDQGPYLSWL